MNGSVNRRELILKSMAGLAGGGLGWLPVEITSHGHSLTDVQSTASVVANFVAMALLSGLIGGLILAAEGQSIRALRSDQAAIWARLHHLRAAVDSRDLLFQPCFQLHPQLRRMGYQSTGIAVLSLSGADHRMGADGPDARRGRGPGELLGAQRHQGRGWRMGRRIPGRTGLRRYRTKLRRPDVASGRLLRRRARDRASDRPGAGIDQGGLAQHRSWQAARNVNTGWSARS